MAPDNNFSQVLNQELSKRKEINKHYSLRAFARDLELEPSSLSKILKRTRIPKEKTTRAILEKLAIPSQQVEQILQLEFDNKKVRNFRLKDNHARYKKLDLETFEKISTPQHYVFLELLKANNCDFTTSWFSRMMNIPNYEVEQIIRDLLKAQMIAFNEEKIIDLTDGFTTHNTDHLETNLIKKNYQRKMNEISRESLELLPFEQRDHSTIIMATNAKKIIEAKKLIKRFRKSLCDFLEDVEDKDSVFALNVDYFPLTQLEESLC